MKTFNASLLIILCITSNALAGVQDLNLKLPFGTGYTWKVDQGYNTTYTHKDSSGGDGHALDFNRSTGSNSDLGEYILAVTSGVVQEVDCPSVPTSSSWGCNVRVQHLVGPYPQECFISHYAHLQTATVLEGDLVSQGDQIGLLGITGTVQAHLHFSIRRCGQNSIEPTGMDGYDWSKSYVDTYLEEGIYVSSQTASNSMPVGYFSTGFQPWINSDSYAVANAHRKNSVANQKLCLAPGDDGGGIYLHEWTGNLDVNGNNILIQNFGGCGDFEKIGAIMTVLNSGEAFAVRAGFWDAYRDDPYGNSNFFGVQYCGAPLEDEGPGNIDGIAYTAVQEFERCYLIWAGNDPNGEPLPVWYKSKDGTPPDTTVYPEVEDEEGIFAVALVEDSEPDPPPGNTTTYKPDFRLENFRMTPENPIDGNDIAFEVDVVNIGDNVSTAVSTMFTLSNGQQYRAAPGLYNGANWATATAYFPEVSAGDYTVTVLADEDDVHDEWNESNNIGVYPFIVSSAAVAPSPPVTGFYAEYWNMPGTGSSPSLPTGPPDLIRVDPSIDFDWGSGSPDPLISADHFIGRWNQNVYLEGGQCTFTVSGDDGTRFYLDFVYIPELDHWFDQDGSQVYQHTMSVTAGTHNIKLEYYENAYGAKVNLDWTCDGQSTGTYYTEIWDMTGAGSSPNLPSGPPDLIIMDEPAHDWGSGSPDPSIPDDHFLIRWNKNVYFAEDDYTFTISGDDGTRFYLDFVYIPELDHWFDQDGSQVYQYTMHVSEGTHNVKLEYYENAGGAKVNLSWEGPN